MISPTGEMFTEFDFLAWVFVRWLSRSAHEMNEVITSAGDIRLAMKTVLDVSHDQLEQIFYRDGDPEVLMTTIGHADRMIFRPVVNDIYAMLPDTIKFRARFGQTILSEKLMREVGSEVCRYPPTLELLRYMFYPSKLDLSSTPIETVIAMVKDIITYIYRQVLSKHPRTQAFNNYDVFTSILELHLDIAATTAEDIRNRNIDEDEYIEAFRIINAIKRDIAIAAREHLLTVCSKLSLDASDAEISGHVNYLNRISNA